MRSVTLAGRLTIIGGGVMGLMTAYQAAPLAEARFAAHEEEVA